MNHNENFVKVPYNFVKVPYEEEIENPLIVEMLRLYNKGKLVEIDLFIQQYIKDHIYNENEDHFEYNIISWLLGRLYSINHEPQRALRMFLKIEHHTLPSFIDINFELGEIYRRLYFEVPEKTEKNEEYKRLSLLYLSEANQNDIRVDLNLMMFKLEGKDQKYRIEEWHNLLIRYPHHPFIIKSLLIEEKEKRREIIQMMKKIPIHFSILSSLHRDLFAILIVERHLEEAIEFYDSIPESAWPPTFKEEITKCKKIIKNVTATIFRWSRIFRYSLRTDKKILLFYSLIRNIAFPLLKNDSIERILSKIRPTLLLNR